MITRQAVVLTVGTVVCMALAALTVALIALAMQPTPAEAEKYNDPTNDNADTFQLDLSDYEPHQNVEGVLVVIDTEGDNPRYYLMDGHEDIASGTFRLINPTPEEVR